MDNENNLRNGDPWTPEEDTLLATMPDQKLAGPLVTKGTRLRPLNDVSASALPNPRELPVINQICDTAFSFSFEFTIILSF